MSSVTLIAAHQSLKYVAEPFRQVVQEAIKKSAQRLTLKHSGADVLVKADTTWLPSPFPMWCWGDVSTYLGIWARLSHKKFPSGVQISFGIARISIEFPQAELFREALPDQLTKIEELVVKTCRYIETQVE